MISNQPNNWNIYNNNNYNNNEDNIIIIMITYNVYKVSVCFSQHRRMRMHIYTEHYLLNRLFNKNFWRCRFHSFIYLFPNGVNSLTLQPLSRPGLVHMKTTLFVSGFFLLSSKLLWLYVRNIENGQKIYFDLVEGTVKLITSVLHCQRSKLDLQWYH